MNTTYALGTFLVVVAGASLGAAQIVSWRRTRRPARLAIEAGPVIVDGTVLASAHRAPTYLDACAQVIHLDGEAPEYHGLDRDDEADADRWVADLERAGYSVIRAQVALDRAYARMVNEEFAAFDRATTEACNRVRAVGSREIIDWANDWKQYAETHAIEAATVEIRGIQEWIDNELAANTAASIVAEMADGELDDEAAALAGTPQ